MSVYDYGSNVGQQIVVVVVAVITMMPINDMPPEEITKREIRE